MSAESEGEEEKEEEDSDGENERSPPLFAGAKTGGSSKTNRDDVLANPTKRKRKRKSTIPAVDSPAMATRSKRGNKYALAYWF